MARRLFNRVKMATATTGTDPLTLGAASNGFQTLADANASDQDVVDYVIEEGDAYEIGVGVYTAATNQLSRSLIESSTGSLLDLNGNATVFAGLVSHSGVLHSERKAIAVALTIAQ